MRTKVPLSWNGISKGSRVTDVHSTWLRPLTEGNTEAQGRRDLPKPVCQGQDGDPKYRIQDTCLPDLAPCHQLSEVLAVSLKKPLL